MRILSRQAGPAAPPAWSAVFIRRPVFHPRVRPLQSLTVALKQSEAIVLRSYPLREADLLVTFFTRA
ncbi:MAG: recombination protein O N-terminal domain-containing protein, partial [Terriglobales bacterium]